MCDSVLNNAGSLEGFRRDDMIWNGSVEMISGLEFFHIIEPGTIPLTKSQIIEHMQAMCADPAIVNHIIAMEIIENGAIILSGNLVSSSCGCGEVPF
jgi:hypothetical protein